MTRMERKQGNRPIALPRRLPSTLPATGADPTIALSLSSSLDRNDCALDARPKKAKSRVCRVGRAAFGKRYLLLCIVLSIRLTGARAATVKGGDIEVEVDVPTEVEVGSSVDLRCEWRLLGENGLYSVKWYKDDHEFFRYVPDNNPKIQTFPQPGINLDKRRNSEKSIGLREVGLTSSGQYKCEVSTEGPSFATIYRAANLTVIAPPERGPEITGLSSHYAVGENVTANCTAWPSVPRAALRWIVNGRSVLPENTIRYTNHYVNDDGDSAENVTSLGLLMETDPGHFEEADGVATIRIKCIAEVGSKALEVEQRVPMAYVKNQRLSASAGDADATGGRSRGDLLRLFSSLILLFLAT